jgi:hypothetical protein
MIPTRSYIMNKIPPPDNSEVLVSKVQTAEEIVGCIMGSVIKSDAYTPNYAGIFMKGNQTVEQLCRDIWTFEKENWNFNPEPADLQTGRSVRYIIYDPIQYSRQLGLAGERIGIRTFDCKHYSTFGLATLRALGIPANLRLCGYDLADPVPTHVYVVAYDQKRNEEIILDGTLDDFNRESESKFKINVKTKTHSE